MSVGLFIVLRKSSWPVCSDMYKSRRLDTRKPTRYLVNELSENLPEGHTLGLTPHLPQSVKYFRDIKIPTPSDSACKIIYFYQSMCSVMEILLDYV